MIVHLNRWGASGSSPSLVGKVDAVSLNFRTGHPAEKKSTIRF
jgi:hypothetical protein